MKKRKIKKGILLLSLTIVIISTALPVTSSAADYIYERGNILWEFESEYNYVTTNKEAKQYILDNVESLTQNNFYYIKIKNNNTEYYMNKYNQYNIYCDYFYNNELTHKLIIWNSSTDLKIKFENFDSTELETEGIKVIIYEVIKKDARAENILSETTNGIKTVLDWVKSLWNGITNGEMRAILPIFAIFIIIPIILLVIKIVKKVVWGD